MSFKREGDSSNWLDNLKRRRVEELFSEDIPEEEALLMKNGRFCCLVCYHRPVFDTVNMLAVHRKGKKHLANADLFNQDKLDLEVEKLKRQHAQYQKTGSTHIPLGPSASSLYGIKKTDAYDPRLKKTRNSKHERKTTLDLDSGSSSVTQPDATPDVDLPGNRISHKNTAMNSKPEAQTIAEYRKHKQFIKDDKLIEVKPYVKKNNHFFHEYANSVAKTSTGYDAVEQKYPSSNDFCDSIKPVRLALAQPSSSVFTSGVKGIESDSIQTSQDSKKSAVSVVYVHNKGRSKLGAKVQKEVKHGLLIDEEKRKLQEKYLHARGSGWLKDRDGNWVKDENVEFDSDEEPPDF